MYIGNYKHVWTIDINIKPSIVAHGAEVSGLNLADLSDHDLHAVYDSWLHYCVLVVRQQSLTENSLVSFSKRMGKLELPPASEIRVSGDGGASLPEIWTISNVTGKGKAIGALGNFEADWHSEMS